jgi:hypothetical protein
VYCHINDTGSRGKDRGELKEGAIATGSGDDADASSSHGVRDPVGGADSCSRKKDRILLDQGYRGGLD